MRAETDTALAEEGGAGAEVGEGLFTEKWTEEEADEDEPASNDTETFIKYTLRCPYFSSATKKSCGPNAARARKLCEAEGSGRTESQGDEAEEENASETRNRPQETEKKDSCSGEKTMPLC